MEQDLRQYLESMEARIGERLDSVVRELEIRTREHDDALELRMREHTETVETRLLGEFWTWARTAEARYRQNHGAVAGLDDV